MGGLRAKAQRWRFDPGRTSSVATTAAATSFKLPIRKTALLTRRGIQAGNLTPASQHHAASDIRKQTTATKTAGQARTQAHQEYQGRAVLRPPSKKQQQQDRQ